MCNKINNWICYLCFSHCLSKLYFAVKSRRNIFFKELFLRVKITKNKIHKVFHFYMHVTLWIKITVARKSSKVVIIKTTDESQTGTDEFQTTKDESQTTKDESQTTKDEWQTTKDESQTNAVEPEKNKQHELQRYIFNL